VIHPAPVIDNEQQFTQSLAICITVITCPSDDIYDAILGTIKGLYTDSEIANVKAEAIRTLSVVAVYGGASDTEIETLMDNFLEIVESDGVSIGAEDNGRVVAAACQEWAFLATSLDDIEDRTEVAMDVFVDQLDSVDPSVQTAAGESIALLYEKSYTPREYDDEPAPKDGMVDDEGYELDTTLVSRYEVYRQKYQLESKLSSLSAESSKRLSKNQRKALHVSFSDILNTVQYPTRGPKYQTAINPETNKRYGSRLAVQIPGSGKLLIDKWWKLHKLRTLRRALGGGWMEHHRTNEVVSESLP
jgi:hypothetical protein